MLKIELKKNHQKSSILTCTRADGSITWKIRTIYRGYIREWKTLKDGETLVFEF